MRGIGAERVSFTCMELDIYIISCAVRKNTLWCSQMRTQDYAHTGIRLGMVLSLVPLDCRDLQMMATQAVVAAEAERRAYERRWVRVFD